MIRPAACLLTLVVALSTAHAANEKLRIGVFGSGSGKGSGPLLSKTELRECLAIESRVVRASNGMASERGQLEGEKAELVRQGEVLKAELEALDRTNVEAIEAHVARAKARDQAIEAFGARSDAFNARVGALDADRAAFRQRCDNRRFDQGDLEAIRKEK